MCLQRMLLKLLRYNLRIVYTKGIKMSFADTLSGTYLTKKCCYFVHSLETIDTTLGLPVRVDHLLQIQHATAEDPGFSLLNDVIKAG